jgi:hypothetical protein
MIPFKTKDARSRADTLLNDAKCQKAKPGLFSGTLLSTVVLLVSIAVVPQQGYAESPSEETVIEGRQENPDLPTLSVLMEWTGVKIAESYVFQVADPQGRILVDRKGISDSKVEIRLKPGRYQRRIGVVNKFGKISFWSPWENFRLVKTREPVIRQLTLQDHTPGQSARIIIQGDNLDEFTEFKATAGKRPVKVWRKQVLNDGRVAIDVDTSDVGSEAEIDIAAENPGKDPDTVNSALVIDGNEASVNQPAFDFGLGDGYTWLIPGYDQFQRGDSTKGYLISGGVFFFTTASLYYAAEANALAQSANDSFSQQLFTNAGLYSALVPSLPGDSLSLFQVDAFSSYQSGQSAYNSAVSSSYGAAAIALLIYGYHLYDVSAGDSPDGLALIAEPRYLESSSSNDPAFGDYNPGASLSAEDRRLQETYMGVGYRLHF